MYLSGLFITGVPVMVPNVTADYIITYNTINIYGNNVTLILSWGEPFNNLDPIVNYTVSCSGDIRCPPNFTITNTAIIITNLTTMTNYTFSVVATNSVGSGEAGVVMITTPPSKAAVIILFIYIRTFTSTYVHAYTDVYHTHTRVVCL